MSGSEFTGTQMHALQVKINNNWTNIAQSGMCNCTETEV
jgi:hypothetical protein